MRLDRGDVHSGAEDEHAVRRGFGGVHRGGHIGEHGHGVGAVQGPARHLDHRSVVGLHHRQRRGVTVDEQQCRGVITDRATDRLGQRCGGVPFGDQHDVVDAVRGQRVAQGGRVRMVGPGDADRLQMVPTGGGAFLGSEDGGDDLIGRTDGCRIINRGDVEDVMIDGNSVGFLPSTSTMRTVVGAIATPNTMSTKPSNVFATLRLSPLRTSRTSRQPEPSSVQPARSLHPCALATALRFRSDRDGMVRAGAG